MKKKSFLLTLLMAIVMMAISPTRMWAEKVQPSGDGTEESPYLLAEDGNFEWLRGQGYDSKNAQKTLYAKMMANYSITDASCFCFCYGTWVLDLNGHSAVTTQTNGVYLNKNGSFSVNLTIKDSSSDKSGSIQSGAYCIAVGNYVSLTIEAGTFIADFYGLYTENENFNQITLRGGTFVNTNSGVFKAMAIESWEKTDLNGYHFVDAITGDEPEIDGAYVYSKQIKVVKTCTYNSNGICTDCGFGEPAVYNEKTQTYEISNGGQLLWFNRHSLNDEYMNAELKADITINTNVLKADSTLNGTPAYEWIVPDYYYRIFDGKNHTISGIYCKGLHKDGQVKSNIAMFGTNKGVIRNVTVKDSYFGYVDNKSHVATFAGENCGTITDCSSFATIKGRRFCGGIAGQSNTSEISYCLYAGKFFPDDENSGPICSDRSDENITNTAVFDCFYLNTCKAGDNVVIRSSSVALDMMKSGNVACWLQDKRSTRVWGQTIDGDTKDDFPVLGGAALYYSKTLCDGKTMADDAELSNTPYESVAAAPHAYGESTTHHDATCKDDGYDLQVCSVCGYENKINIVAAADHTDADKDGFCDKCHCFNSEAPVLVTGENYKTLGLDAKYIGYKAISTLAQLAGFAEEMNGAVVSASIAGSGLEVGDNKVSIPGNGYEVYPFTPTQSGVYIFTMQAAGVGLSANEDDYEKGNPPLTSGLGGCSYECQKGVTYYVCVANLTSNDFVDAPLRISMLGGTQVHVGQNSVSVASNSSELFTFTPSSTNTYSFSAPYLMLFLFDANPSIGPATSLEMGTGSISYLCEEGTEYYLGISNMSSADANNVTLTITPASTSPIVAQKAPRRRAAADAQEEPNYKYVLADDIVMNANLLDKEGKPQIYDENGVLRTNLLAWKSPEFDVYDYEKEKYIRAIFDGNGHTISGLYQNEAYDESLGFLSAIGAADTICNLGIKDSYFCNEKDCEYYDCGSIVASCYGGVVSNCWSDATIADNGSYESNKGGIVGYITCSTTVKDCHYDGTMYSGLSDDGYFGGIVGYVNSYNYYLVSITNCHFSGKYINAPESRNNYFSFGGIVDKVYLDDNSAGIDNVVIDRCYADGSVTSGCEMFIGGIVNYVETSGDVAITNCYNALEITNSDNGSYKLGGMVGACGSNDDSYGMLTITSSFSYGDYSEADQYYPDYVSNYGVNMSIKNIYYLEGSNDSPSSPDADDNAFAIGAKRRVVVAPGGIALPDAFEVIGATAEQFASGEIAYKLNNGNFDADDDDDDDDDDEPICAPRRVDAALAEAEEMEGVPLVIIPGSGETLPEAAEDSSPAWYQTIGVDKYPVLKGDEYTLVYYDEEEGIYYNKERSFDEYELVDAEEYDLNADFKVVDFSYTRTFEGTNWTTWYVPFDLELTEDICKKYAFARINNVHQYDADDDGEADRTVVESFRLTEGCIIKANYPYLVRALTEDAKNMSVELENMTLYAAKENSIDCHSVDYNYSFTGTYSGIGIEDAKVNQYSLFDGGDDDSGENGWSRFLDLQPQRHYLTIESRDPNAALFVISFVKLMVIGDEDETGIVRLYSGERQKAETYDLTGRRISSGSQQRGIRIENGKKILVK